MWSRLAASESAPNFHPLHVMFLAIALAREAWPKDIPVREFNGTNANAHLEEYKAFLAEKSAAVTTFVERIHQEFIPNVDASSSNCSDTYCTAFREVTGLTEGDYALYNAFLEAAQDNMLLIHG